MRTAQLHYRSLLLAMIALVGLVVLTGCPKRQTDGLVFEEATEKKTKKTKKPKSSGSSRKGDMMYGRIVDRNDQPLKRVTILVTPGNAEIVSNKWGEYEVDGLHNEDGSRAPLKKGQDYTITAWKPGYHETTQIFRYEGATQEIPTITLIEDSIKLEPQEAMPILPSQTNDDTGPAAAGKSVENE